MRQRLIVQPQASPLAQAFGSITQSLGKRGSADENALKEAMAQQYNTKAQAGFSQAEALNSAGTTLGQLFKQYTPQGIPTDQFVGPPPETGLPTEAPDQRAQRLSTGLADLYARVGKDNAEALNSGMATGQAFGSPDDMRRSMVIQGKNIDQNFAPTATEADHIALRNEQAKPLSDSQVKGRRLDQNFDNLDKLNPLQQQALGALPPGTETIEATPGGGFKITKGGAAGAKATQMAKSQDDVSYLLDQARTSVNNLQTMGALPDENGSTGSRAMAAAGAYPNPANERLQRVINPKTQAERDNILALRSNLLSKYRTAAQIPASASNSDIEQKTLKEALPDPELSAAANNQRIANFERLYGAAKAAYPEQAAPAPAAGAAAPQANMASDAIAGARQAIASGRSRAAVIQRLQESGITPPPDL